MKLMPSISCNPGKFCYQCIEPWGSKSSFVQSDENHKAESVDLPCSGGVFSALSD